MQQNPYYNPMPDQNQGGWRYDPEPSRYPMIDDYNLHQQQKANIWDDAFSWDRMKQVANEYPSFWSGVFPTAGAEIGNMAGNAWGSMWGQQQPEAIAKASPRQTQGQDNYFGWR